MFINGYYVYMDLARTQFLSLVTKAITTFLGIAQSILVVRILSPAEYGLVGLVMSVGAVIGVSQHLGIVDGAIREIAIRKKKRDVGKVFWVSHAFRQAVTIPLSIILLLFASAIAGGVYNHPEIAVYIQIFAAALVLQGLQDVLGATLTGMKKFGALYIVQVVTAVINIAVFGLLTWMYGVWGFFIAIVITTSIMVVLLGGLVARHLKGNLALPSRRDIKKYGRNVMRIGAFMYLARIFFVVWQRLPILVLGGVLAADELGYLNVSLTFGSRLTIIAMALSEVNLSWMSSLFTSNRQEFARVVTRNMRRVLVLMTLMTMVLLFFTPEILRYVIGAEYLPAQALIYIFTLAFYLYALIDIGTSSVFVPANKPKMRALVYGSMTGLSGILIAWILLVRPDAMLAAYAILAGAVLAYGLMVVVSRKKFGISLLTPALAVFLVALAGSVWWLYSSPSLFWRIGVFVLLALFILWETKRSNLLPRNLFSRVRSTTSKEVSVICFAGAEYDQSSWTNRQHIMSRVSKKYRVLYVEPRVWIVRYVLRNVFRPIVLVRFFKKLFWYEKKSERLYVKAQWNLIPWSREYRFIGLFNHYINSWRVLMIARRLGFRKGKQVMWIYDTEAAEYLRSFQDATVVYDCVDDHAAQAGVDRNPKRVVEEESRILDRADLVTVTSKKLYEMKKNKNDNVHLVLNAGDVELFEKKVRAPKVFSDIKRPIVGMVGALDAYKVDFGLVYGVARKMPDWSFVFVGAPVVDRKNRLMKKLEALDNVYMVGAMPRKQVPAYVHAFDVCLIPYKGSRYNASSFPLKFWEFMATGKPIVVSGLPELKSFKGDIFYVTSVKKMVVGLTSALKEKGKSGHRISLAKSHTWQKRVDALLKLLHSTMNI